MIKLEPEEVKYIEVLARLNRFSGPFNTSSCQLGEPCSDELSEEYFFLKSIYGTAIELRRPCTKHLLMYKNSCWKRLE